MTKLYAEELMKKLVTEEEMIILEKIWDTDITTKETIVQLVEEK